MARVSTNNTQLSVTPESFDSNGNPDFGVIPNDTPWYLLEPNTISTFGATVGTVARAPISKNRQRRAGTLTSLDSAVEFEHDTTVALVRRFMPGFIFAKSSTHPVDELKVTGVAGTTVTLDITIDGRTDGYFPEDALFAIVDGPGKGNLVHLSAASASGSTVEVTAGSGVDAGSVLRFAGHRDTNIAVTEFSESNGILTISGVDGAVAAVKGGGGRLGQYFAFGSVTSTGVPQHNAPLVDGKITYGRLREFSGTDTLKFDKLPDGFPTGNVAAAISTFDLLWGSLYQNTAVGNEFTNDGDPEYLEQAFQFEAFLSGLTDETISGNDKSAPYQYAKGNFCNTFGLSLPLEDKSVTTLAFIGTDTDSPVATRQKGTTTEHAPIEVEALNTTNDIARLRVAKTDESGLTTDFKSMTLTLNNNVSAEKVLAHLGAKYMNTGTFDVGLETQILFTDAGVPRAIRNNEPTTFDAILHNGDGVIILDIPELRLGGGEREFPVNESVLATLTGSANEDPHFGVSLSVTVWPLPILG